MKFNLYNELNSADKEKNKPEPGELDKVKNIVSDRDYLQFLELTNGGSVLDSALHFYGVLPIKLELEIFYNNFLFTKYYKELLSNIFVFAEDAFGNQFGFLNESVVFFNIETASIDHIFKDFDQFVSELSNDLDFFSGFSIVNKWQKKHGPIEENKRLCPVKPFVIGGEYSIENLYALNKEDLLDYNSNIAKQIKDLPDGTEVNLSVT